MDEVAVAECIEVDKVSALKVGDVVAGREGRPTLIPPGGIGNLLGNRFSGEDATGLGTANYHAANVQRNG